MPGFRSWLRGRVNWLLDGMGEGRGEGLGYGQLDSGYSRVWVTGGGGFRYLLGDPGGVLSTGSLPLH